MSSEQSFLKDIQNYMFSAMQKVSPGEIDRDEFVQLMTPAMDLLDDAGISIKDVELKDNTVWIYY